MKEREREGETKKEGRKEERVPFRSHLNPSRATTQSRFQTRNFQGASRARNAGIIPIAPHHYASTYFHNDSLGNDGNREDARVSGVYLYYLGEHPTVGGTPRGKKRSPPPERVTVVSFSPIFFFLFSSSPPPDSSPRAFRTGVTANLRLLLPRDFN